MLKTQKTHRARDNWHAKETKLITPSIRKQLFIQLIKQFKTCNTHTLHQYKMHCVYVFVKHAPDKQRFIDFDSRKAEFQNQRDLIVAEDYK